MDYKKIFLIRVDAGDSQLTRQKSQCQVNSVAITKGEPKHLKVLKQFIFLR